MKKLFFFALILTFPFSADCQDAGKVQITVESEMGSYLGHYRKEPYWGAPGKNRPPSRPGLHLRAGIEYELLVAGNFSLSTGIQLVLLNEKAHVFYNHCFLTPGEPCTKIYRCVDRVEYTAIGFPFRLQYLIPVKEDSNNQILT